jgi:hypothetical protein
MPDKTAFKPVSFDLSDLLGTAYRKINPKYAKN